LLKTFRELLDWALIKELGNLLGLMILSDSVIILVLTWRCHAQYFLVLAGLFHLAVNLVSLHVKSWRLEQRAGTLAFLTTLATAIVTTSIGKLKGPWPFSLPQPQPSAQPALVSFRGTGHPHHQHG
jgi:hypothetical protein